MIRKASDVRSMNLKNTKKPNGHSGNWYDDVVNNDMELDDPPAANNGWDRMDIEGSNDGEVVYDNLMQETIQYGQVLEAEFRDDPRREIHKSLNDAFALLAYEDPYNSKELSHLLRHEGRVAVAEELNSAILGMCSFHIIHEQQLFSHKNMINPFLSFGLY